MGKAGLNGAVASHVAALPRPPGACRALPAELPALSLLSTAYLPLIPACAEREGRRGNDTVCGARYVLARPARKECSLHERGIRLAHWTRAHVETEGALLACRCIRYKRTQHARGLIQGRSLASQRSLVCGG